ncbi:metal ABC transporter ATP-binding protein [Nitratifractor sp.]
MKAISVHGLRFSYDREPVLHDVDLEVDEHEFVAVIGPNGGGKSTLLRLIMGQLRPDAGEIAIFGAPPRRARDRIGYVPQNTNVNLQFPIRILDVVMMGNPRKHREATRWWERLFSMRYNDVELRCARTTLEKVGLECALDRRIGELSGGQRQRVMIARALCAHPRLLILDEPTSSLDAEGQKQIYSLLRELSRDLTVLVVSHDLSAVTEYADKVVYLNRTAYTHDLRANPIHLHTPEGEHFCEIELMQELAAKTCECEHHRGKGGT